MTVIKVIITIVLAISSLVGVIIGSYYFVQDNPFDTSHKHDIVLIEATEATCTEPGLKAHYKCKGCGEMFADKTGYAVIGIDIISSNPNGHQWQSATCSTPKSCIVCSATEGERVAHNPKNSVKENIIPPVDCQTPGSYDSVVYCKDCNELISRESVEIKGGSHTPGEPVVENEREGDCLTCGTYDSVIYCEKCDDEVSRVAKESDPLGHIDIDPVDSKCDRCSAEMCTEHIVVVQPAVEATCVSNGLTEGKYCSVCGMTLVRQEVIVGAHNFIYDVTGNLIIMPDGTYDTNQLTVTVTCTACEDYGINNITYTPDGIGGYYVSATNAMENGGSIVYGNYKIDFPALSDAGYTLLSTYNGNDKTPTVYTAFSRENLNFSISLVSDYCLDINGDGTVYSKYELNKLNNENATVTYDAATGYVYASKQQHTLAYLAAYGADVTVTGDVHVIASKRINVNTHLIVGTDTAPANLKIERAAAESSNNQVIALWQSGCLTIKNGTLTTVGKASANWAVDIYISASSSTNPSSKSVITIEEKGKFVTDGSGEYAVFIAQGSDGRLIIDGTLTSNRNLVVASNFAVASEYEYGFQPSLYIRRGTVIIDGASKPACVSSIQVGSVAENATGYLTINTIGADCFRMATKNIKYTFAKGTLNLTTTVNDKTIFQMGGDGNQGLTAYRPYYDGDGYVKGDIDFKKDIVVNASGEAGSKDNYFVGVWRSQDTYVQNWMFEEGATFNLTNMKFFVRTPSGNNIKVVAYKELELNIDGSLKKVIVASELKGAITTANTASNLNYPSVDTSVAWTTDQNAEQINGFKIATDTNGNKIYYK